MSPAPPCEFVIVHDAFAVVAVGATRLHILISPRPPALFMTRGVPETVAASEVLKNAVAIEPVCPLPFA